MIEAVLFSVALMFPDTCLGITPPVGISCGQMLTRGTLSIVVRYEDDKKWYVERRCSDDGSCLERILGESGARR